ncbi:MAG: hemolysin family protein [Actinomycetota bacterium]|nr:hemolysin family protein [Actinomycetota bacterium]
MTLAVIAVAVLWLVSALAVIADTALSRVDRDRAESLVSDRRRRRTGALVAMVERREERLQPILFLDRAARITAATIVAIVAADRGDVWLVVLAVAIEIPVAHFVTLALPRVWSIRHLDRAALIAPLVARVATVAVPFTLVADLCLRLARLIVPGSEGRDGPEHDDEEDDTSADDEAQEEQLLSSVFSFTETVVRTVLVPRTDVVAAPEDLTVRDTMELAVLHGFSRIPLHSPEGIDHIVGVVYAKDLMQSELDGHGDEPVRTRMREPRFVPETKRVAELLREMQNESFHFAVVVDEYGGTAGIVTLEDVIEELVGEIFDEFDHVDPLVVPLTDGRVRVSARMAVSDLGDHLDIDPPTGDWETVGGLVFSRLGRVPRRGDAVMLDGWTVTVTKVKGRRVEDVVFARAPRSPEADQPHRSDRSNGVERLDSELRRG